MNFSRKIIVFLSVLVALFVIATLYFELPNVFVSASSCGEMDFLCLNVAIPILGFYFIVIPLVAAIIGLLLANPGEKIYVAKTTCAITFFAVVLGFLTYQVIYRMGYGPAAERDRNYKSDVVQADRAIKDQTLQPGAVITEQGKVSYSTEFSVLIYKEVNNKNSRGETTGPIVLHSVVYKSIPGSKNYTQCLNLLDNLEEVRKLVPGQRVEIHGIVITKEEISTCGSKDYYIHKI